MNPGVDMVWTTVKLAGVLLAMIAALVLLQRITIRTRLGGFIGSPIRILHTLRIGVRTHIVFLHLPETVLVLGVTPSSITNLMTITEKSQINLLLHKPINQSLFQRFLSERLNLHGRTSRESEKRGADHVG